MKILLLFLFIPFISNAQSNIKWDLITKHKINLTGVGSIDNSLKATFTRCYPNKKEIIFNYISEGKVDSVFYTSFVITKGVYYFTTGKYSYVQYDPANKTIIISDHSSGVSVKLYP